MKKKMHKILGTGLSLVLAIVFTLGIAAPAAADDEEWSVGEAPFDLPSESSAGDWFYDPELEDQGIMVEAINGDLYVYAYDEGDDDYHIFKSDDDGRTWAATDYDDDGGTAVVAMAPSSIDADVLYVADVDQVFKTTDGDDFAQLSAATMPDIFDGDPDDEEITSIAVGYLNDAPVVYFGTKDPTDGNATGHVYYINEDALGASWTDLDIDDDETVDVYGLATSPDYDSDTLLVVIGADTDETYIMTNSGATVGGFTSNELLNEAGTNLLITAASNPVFVDDFDVSDSWEVFVGVVGAVHTTSSDGGVYRIDGTDDGDSDLMDDVDNDIISLDIVGNQGSSVLIAGVNDEAEVWTSYDDGDSWDDADKAPSGDGPTYVVIDEDFDDGAGQAWAVTSDGEGGVSLSEDGAVTWNQIGLIDTDIDNVTDLLLGSIDFLVTLDTGANTSSLFSNDGSNWERVFSSSVSGDDFDLIAVSPENSDTLFVAGTEEYSGTEEVWRSTDQGQDWTILRRQPDEIEAHGAFLVLDDDTIIVGGDGSTYITDRNGARDWTEEAITDCEDIISIAASPDVDNDDTLLIGDNEGNVFLSTDLAADFDQVGATLDDDDETFVAFHPDFATSGADGENCAFAGSGDQVYLFEDLTDDYDDDDWDDLDGADLDVVYGITVAANGTLYVLDEGDGDGMNRCLDPLDLDPNDGEEFEQLNEDVETDTELTHMHLADGSSPVIWALDVEEAEIWSITDTLAVPVTLVSPPSGTTSGRDDSVTFNWTELANADSYTVQVYRQGTLSQEDALDATPIETSAAVANGETYEVPAAQQGIKMLWRVRADAPIDSKWSDVWTFTTKLTGGLWTPFEGSVSEAPATGADDVMLKPTFVWNAADRASGYEFVLADNSNFTSAIVKKTVATTAYVADQELEYATTYYWRVRAVSSTSNSEWGVGVFTTIAKPTKAPPPIVVEPTPPASPPVQLPPIQLPPVTIPGPPAPIPPYLLWTIVGIGAALVIAVIVLIVRTRARP